MKVMALALNQRHQSNLDSRSERNLAVAILRQAWHEAVLDLDAVKRHSRKDYRRLKTQAIEWIGSDEDGFTYWCEMADVDHRAIRQKLDARLSLQRPRVQA